MNEQTKTVHRGRFLEFRTCGTWEYVARTTGPDTVGILAVTPEDKIILIAQYRIPVGKVCVEIPAGLADAGESWKAAAIRELREETGYTAQDVELLTEGPTSAGLTNESIKLVRAIGVRKAGMPEPDGDEHIEVFEVPAKDVTTFLRSREALGHVVDPKVWAALFFLKPLC